jgi:hypothetical protein
MVGMDTPSESVRVDPTSGVIVWPPGYITGLAQNPRQSALSVIIARMTRLIDRR